ncbi:MAG: light-independent protochlorophyllide reductase, iron-sulfur ATP-binding protein, partial [Pseudomonadota bacterium]
MNSAIDPALLREPAGEPVHIPLTSIGRGRPARLGDPRLDGEGSVQVALDPALKIGTAKVFAVYGKGG